MEHLGRKEIEGILDALVLPDLMVLKVKLEMTAMQGHLDPQGQM